jgi:phosphatidylserine/phosphatidylglycerophosphate/cardiolipin synthase-like enzyme
MRQELTIKPMKQWALSIVLMGGLLLITACVGSSANDYQPTPIMPTSAGQLTGAPEPTSTEPSEGVELFFTTPGHGETGAPADAMRDAIDRAQTSVDLAGYNLSMDRIGWALLQARERGVRVRLVLDDDAIGRRVPKMLIEQGMDVVSDPDDPIMHNKFLVIDGKEVWTGSLNLTDSGNYKDNNVVLHVRSREFAQNYTVEFEEMFKKKSFGANSPANTPFTRLEVDGVPLEVYFAPEDHDKNVAGRIVELVSSAQQEVRVLAYSLTLDELANALVDRRDAGIEVSGVFEESQVRSNQGGDFCFLLHEEVPMRLDGNPGLMHTKALVVDREWVVLGSYNFSYFANTRNDENLVIMRDRALAQQMLAEFERIWGGAQSAKDSAAVCP